MAKNIVICLDGTSNEFGHLNTNVVRLFQCLDLSDSTKQVGFYGPGVGTMAAPGLFTKIAKQASVGLGLGFGAGLVRNIEEAYRFLIANYQHHDKVYIFGFSRGAYTARALAGLLRQLGVLARGADNLVPYATKLFQSIKEDISANGEINYWKTSNSFKSTFAGTKKQCPVEFLGLWDTVSSVGWIWNPQSFPYVSNNPGIRIVRHALAIDERRWFFRQTHWGDKFRAKQDVKEMWFPGVHSDIGGAYQLSDNQLWRAPFFWILGAAKRSGLLLDTLRVQAMFHHSKPFLLDYATPAHRSLVGRWHFAELCPKIRWSEKYKFKYLASGLWRWRKIRDDEYIHKSALHRIRDSRIKYTPKTLSKTFRQRVQGFGTVPSFIPYKP